MKRSNRSRRTFLKTAAGVAAGTVLSRDPLWAQVTAPRAAAVGRRTFPQITPAYMITPKEAWDWHVLKARGGPTYAGSDGWRRFTSFLLAKLPEFGAVDLDFVTIPYDHYIVDDWPDRDTHIYRSGKAVEKLISDDTPVPVVASYGMTSGSTPPEGITAAMVYYDPAQPPTAEQTAGKILVFQTAKQPAGPYTNQFMESYTLTDYEWRSPGKWPALYVPPALNVTTSYHTRWVWSQLGGFAQIGIKARAAGIVVVYDLSPGAAFGLAQRSVYTADGRAGLGAAYVNCPTLTLDRVNGAKVVADARAGKTATLTLTARFQRDNGRAMVAYLPGKDYGTPRDEQILVATHTDAMSLIEENGGLGLLGIMSYFNKIPKASRPRTLVFYFDCRHFMPGGEGSWPQFDYYTMHPERLKPIVATIGVEHMGGKQTIEIGDTYVYSSEEPQDGGVITSLMDVYNNNIWLVETIAKAATDNGWPRVDVKAGNVAPGVNGGLQASVRSPMNKGRSYDLPGVGLAGDWPGAWTQTYAQTDTEAGPHGFDENYFVQQVAGLSQIAGEMMLVKPSVIDLGWGRLKSALLNLPDAGFAAANARQLLLNQYVSAFRNLESGALDRAKTSLRDLAANVSALVVPDKQTDLKVFIDTQLKKIS